MNDSKTIHSGIVKILLTLLTQAAIMALSVVTEFVLPNKMGSEMYGYWQIYLFYLSYIPLFGLGFNDGLTLFYGGKEYADLPYKKIRSAVRLFSVYLLAAAVICFFLSMAVFSGERRFIYEILSVSIPLVALQCVVLSVFLAVGRTSVYNGINFIAKAVAVAFYLVLIFVLGITASRQMIMADFAARFAVAALSIIIGRKFIFGHAEPARLGFGELSEKMRSGIKITLAALISQFIPVCGRLVVEWNEPVATYGKYAFAMSLLTVIMTFTSAAGSVFFPVLKKFDEQKLSSYYGIFSALYHALIYLALILYIPMLFIVRRFMKEYVPVLGYIHILLVMCVPLGKMQLILVAYYKAYRKERPLFISNLIGGACVLACTFAAYYLFRSVEAVAAATSAVMYLWTLGTEIYLTKKIGAPFDKKSCAAEIIMMAVFLGAAWGQDIVRFAAIYGAALVLYVIIFRKQIKEFIVMFRGR